MYADDIVAMCGECGEPLANMESTGVCILCAQLFCRRHVTFRKGVANCGKCEEPRRILEANGGVSDADEARIVGLLLNDIENTIGAGQHAVVEEAAARIRLFSDDPSDFEHRVVDEVQQHIHDTYADTTWPHCPEHPNHPLWCVDGWWACHTTGNRVAQLGALATDER